MSDVCFVFASAVEKDANKIKMSKFKYMSSDFLNKGRLPPDDDIENLSNKLNKIAKKAEEDALDDLLNPLAGKVAFREYAEALTKTK